MTKVKKQKTVDLTEKKISSIKLVYLILSLLIVGMVILYSSDSFMSFPAAEQTTFNGDVGLQNDAAPNSGADLNQLQRIKELEILYEKSPNIETLLELGHLYNDSGFFEKAINSYKKYLESNPTNADVIVDMGVCYFNLKNYEQAKTVMSGALKINPNHQIAKFNLGIVNFSAGDVDQAKQWWKQAIEINPNSEIAQRAKSLMESH